MLEPVKFLYKLWDRIEKSGISRKRKDFLLTAIALAIVAYVLVFPLLVIWAKQVTDMIQKALGL
jgi:hypothetical protein